MKARELRDMKVEELEARTRTLTEDLVTARFKLHTNQLEKVSELTRLRRDIARIKTVIREKQASA